MTNLRAYGWGIVDNEGICCTSYSYDDSGKLYAEGKVSEWNLISAGPMVKGQPYRVVQLFYKEEGVPD